MLPKTDGRTQGPAVTIGKVTETYSSSDLLADRSLRDVVSIFHEHVRSRPDDNTITAAQLYAMVNKVFPNVQFAPEANHAADQPVAVSDVRRAFREVLGPHARLSGQVNASHAKVVLDKTMQTNHELQIGFHEASSRPWPKERRWTKEQGRQAALDVAVLVEMADNSDSENATPPELLTPLALLGRRLPTESD